MGVGESGIPKVHDGDAVASQRAGVIVHGSDGTNIQVIKTNASGEVYIANPGGGGGGGGAITFDISDGDYLHTSVTLPSQTSTQLLPAATLTRVYTYIQNASAYRVWVQLDSAAAANNQGLYLETGDALLLDQSDINIQQGVINAYQDSLDTAIVYITYLEV